MYTVKLFKGASFVKTANLMKKSISPKVITFDLDETLGSFGDLYILWQSLDPHIPAHIDKFNVFCELNKLYPEFLRPGIFPILEFLSHKKREGICSHVFLYTNNQASKEWVDLIIRFFNLKVPDLFDKTVCAFKIGNQKVEPMRTSHIKSYNDLIRCTMLPKNSELCFVDNTYHPKMIHDRVYYIQPKSYHHGLGADEIVERFNDSWVIFPLPNTFESTLHEQFLHKWPTKKDPSINMTSFDISQKVSKKIMYYLKEYFILSTKSPKTKKITLSLGRFTRKKLR